MTSLLAFTKPDGVGYCVPSFDARGEPEGLFDMAGVCDASAVATVCVTDPEGDTDTVAEARPVATVAVTVTDGDIDPDTVDKPVATVRVTVCVNDTVEDESAVAIVCVTDCVTDTVRETVCVTDTVSEDVADGHGVTPPDTVSDVVADRHSVALPDSDAKIVADAVGVDPAGAQNGPMLNVARCVPSMELTGVTDAMEGEPVLDAMPVATVRVTDTVCVSVTDCVGDCVADRHSVALPDSDDCGVDDRHSVALPDSDAIVADAVGVDPAGAQNGPMLNVARWVPSTDASGEADATVADPVTDASPVAIV